MRELESESEADGLCRAAALLLFPYSTHPYYANDGDEYATCKCGNEPKPPSVDGSENE